MPGKETKRQRKELAKNQRMQMQRRMARRKTMTKIYVGVGAIVVIAGIVVAVMLSSKANHDKVAKQNAAVDSLASAVSCGGTVQAPTDEGREHVTTGQPVQYHQNPPTSGNHWISSTPPFAPGPTGVLTSQPQDEVYVHNLEHSHMGIWYDAAKLPADVKAALEDFTNKNKTAVFMAPRASFGAELAFTSWDHYLKCGATLKDDPSKVAGLAKAYHDAHKGDGPEGFITGSPAS
ncbi:MAG: DUF3105 domain-containing protein [Actinomycetota bacterium]